MHFVTETIAGKKIVKHVCNVPFETLVNGEMVQSTETNESNVACEMVYNASTKKFKEQE